ncbi:MAG: hypothetical protein P4L85_24070 [Paludisphaera borealis]|uniref:hypothetical protein n=1 Tax=Paludisphaera borealis TaxID=1387353 RepID=UPI0028518DBB|nr:hypothetical protein [Paludisphaera borealis]MDR3622449.1 hypothetical protein [Paludisphaera borealis]
MVAVVLAAILLAVFRAGSLMGLAALFPFAITAIIAGSGSSPSVRRWALSVGAVGVLLVPFLVAIWINHEMWGYYVSRPDVDRRIVNARRIETITDVKTVTDAHGLRAFSGAPAGDLETYLQVHPQEGDYYVLGGRVLRTLKYRDVLPEEVRGIPPSRLESLYQVLDESGRLEDGEPGYSDAKSLSGIVVEALGGDGRPLLFVGVEGREVSNDHYPFYEFLFTSDSPGGPLKLLSYQRFYYDVAGIEGLEWPAFLLIFAFIGLIPTLPVQGFLLWRGRRRA